MVEGNPLQDEMRNASGIDYEETLKYGNCIVSMMKSSNQVLALLTNLMGASMMLPEEQVNEASGEPVLAALHSKEIVALIETLVTGNDGKSEFSFSCPSLSLHHHHKDRRGSSESSDEDSEFSSASSSISHVSEEDNDDDCKRKVAAEEHAVKLLARPLQLPSSVKGMVEGNDSHFLRVLPLQEEQVKAASNPLSASVGQVPSTLLQNIYSSFAILVDSRIHAYTVFLARHAMAISMRKSVGNSDNDQRVANIQQKLEAILKVGSLVTADAVVTSFESINDNDGEKSLKFALLVAMDFCIRVPSSALHKFSVTFAAPGQTNATFTSGGILESIVFSVDTKQLLANMIQGASTVVSNVVDIANTVCAQIANSNQGENGTGDETESTMKSSPSKKRCNKSINNASSEDTLKAQTKLRRTASFLAMPPPMPKNVNSSSTGSGNAQFAINDLKPQPAFNLGLDLLSKAAADMTIVSPDMTGIRNPYSTLMPNITLEEQKDERDDDDVSHLSADQCANIIDTCLFSSDPDDPFDEPPAKRIKL